MNMNTTSSTDEQTPRPHSAFLQRRKGPPAALRIHAPVHNSPLTIMRDDPSSSSTASASSSSTASSANSDSDPALPFSRPDKPRSMRNMKRLSLILPAALDSNTSSNSLPSDPDQAPSDDPSQPSSSLASRRRPSILSLPPATGATRLHRKDEDDSPTIPYLNGPIEILPNVWLGSEDNARDWDALAQRGIRAILNVAREVNSPFDPQTLRPFISEPDLKERSRESLSTFHPAHGPSGRPAMHYLKLPWSHGQKNLVHEGFVDAMAFVDAALERGDGVLVHCQCGVSRSATVVIALVMRAAALESPKLPVPAEVASLKGGGMHAAYAYVKEKSKWAGPNMSLIYQLLDYERVLNGSDKSPSASEGSSAAAEDDEEWDRRRRLMEDGPSNAADVDNDRESLEVMREAHALDKAMEERVVSRKASGSSLGSSSGVGMPAAWKSRYRAGSITSNLTSGSVLDENLIEENEEPELLGVGGGFDAPSLSSRSPSGETTESSEANSSSPDWKTDTVSSSFHLDLPPPPTAKPELLGKQRSFTDSDLRGKLRPPPSAPPTKSTFGFASRLSFKLNLSRRQPSSALPPVPPSPVVSAPPKELSPLQDGFPSRSSKRIPPPLRLHSAGQSRSSSCSSQLSKLSTMSTPAQTLFVFPPSPTLQTHTPHMVTVTSNLGVSSPFPAAALTPRVSSFKSNGRRRSYIGLGVPATPTTACSRVDARGLLCVSSPA